LIGLQSQPFLLNPGELIEFFPDFRRFMAGAVACERSADAAADEAGDQWF